MGSVGRRTKAYLEARKRILGQRCWLNYPGCTGIGTTADHVPPLSTAPHPSLWQGELRPACQHCQASQGARIRNNRQRSRNW